MEKARVILADTDVRYVQALQLKFIDEFYERVDLEIITDPSYFEELFSTPQQAEILIVSEEMFDASLKRHNIAHLFVLTESRETDSYDDASVIPIYKYSSVLEIFNEILGEGADVLFTRGESEKKTQILLVTSAAGGAGKTTVAMGLASALAKNYKRVLYLDAEPMQTFQYLLKNSSPITGSEIYAALQQADETIYARIRHVIRQEGFSYLPPFRAAMFSLGFGPEVFPAIAESARDSGEYDYIVIDSDSSFDEHKAALINLADRVVLVTGQNRASVMATDTLAANVNGIEEEKYVFLCNRYDPEQDNTLVTSNASLRFGVNEYISCFKNYDDMRSRDFADLRDFKRAVYLVR